MTLRDQLVGWNACQEAIDWLGDRDLETAWRECERADWMLWLSDKIAVDKKLVVLSGVRCGETSLKYVPKGEKRPLLAYKTTRRWLRGEATTQEVNVAAWAVADAAADAAAWAAWAAADEAANVANAANAAYEAVNAARNKARKEMSEIVRKTIPLKTIMEAYNR